MKRFVGLVVIPALLGGCAPRVDPAFFTDIKALRPSGYGNTNYGLATECRPGACLGAQREYHQRYLVIVNKYGVSALAAYTAAIFPYAEAVAARIEAAEISPAQGEAMVQEFRLRANAEIARVRAVQEQTDVARWSAFWGAQTYFLQQQAIRNQMRPIRCTTGNFGTISTTSCF